MTRRELPNAPGGDGSQALNTTFTFARWPVRLRRILPLPTLGFSSIAEGRTGRAPEDVVDPLLWVILVAELVEERSQINLALRRVPRTEIAEHLLEEHAFGPIAGTIGLASTVWHRYRHLVRSLVRRRASATSVAKSPR